MDAEAGLKFLTQQGYSKESIIVYGRSIGTAASTYLVNKHPQIGGLALESFAHFSKLVNQRFWYLLPWLTLITTSTIVNCKESKPIPILHGTSDKPIPRNPKGSKGMHPTLQILLKSKGEDTTI